MNVDVEQIRALVHLMNENHLVELEIEEDGKRISLKKGGLGQSQVAVTPEGLTPQARPSGPAVAPPESPGLHRVNSPMVGTFYRAPSPDSDPFVEVGDVVTPDSVLCIIEAMKVMNEIRAEVEGTVQQILVANGEAVEYAQPLFVIATER